MTLTCVTSAKGAPGATTTALALAAVTGSPSVVFEADRSGGDLACWCGPSLQGGLIELATKAAAHDITATAEPLPSGALAVAAPPAAAATTAALNALDATFWDGLMQRDAPVFVDLGRWTGSPVERAILARADSVLLVCRATPESVLHTRELAQSLLGVAQSAVVVGATRSTTTADVNTALGIPIGGMLPWDPRGVRALRGQASARTWRRCPLAAAARALHLTVTEGRTHAPTHG